MRLQEVMGIEQNRRWGVCSMNDFRRFLGLKPYASFKEWNPDPEIYGAAEKLYGNIERLELYVGLQAEEAKPVVEGAGLCPGYTISRAILSDAMALTRGDRFYTSDYTPYNMTAWGFADCQKQPAGAGFGSTLGRLFLRTLPNDYSANSVYTWFPLMTPPSMKINLTKLKVMRKYDMNRPTTSTPAAVVTDYHRVAQILKDTAGFQAPYAARAALVIKGNGFFLASADPARGEREQRAVLGALLYTPESPNKIGQYFYNKTRELITANSFSLVGGKSRCVDVVRYVLRHVPVHWAATEIAGIPLKTKQNPHGVYTPEQLFTILGDIYSFVFLEVDPHKLIVLQDKVKGHVTELLRHIQNNLSIYGGRGMSITSLADLVDTISQLFAKARTTDRDELVKRLQALGHSSDEVANSILAIMVGFTVELSIALTNTVNTYLGTPGAAERHTLAVKSEPSSHLEGFVREALRLDPPFQGVYRVAQKDHAIASMSVKKDDRLFLNIAHANLDNLVFKNPTTIVTDRTLDQYLNGDVTVRCLGNHLTTKVVGEVLRAVMTLPNARRANGQSGTLTRFQDQSQLSLHYSYLDDNEFPAPWPTSLVIQYDVI
jgi:linoleate 10R-lipoxygenase